MDLWYCDNWSIRLDLKILWRTIGLVLRSSGAVIDQGPTDETFSHCPNEESDDQSTGQMSGSD